MITRISVAVCSMLLWGLRVFAQQPQPAQRGFEPVGPGAVVEQLPAAPLIISAYAFVWLVVLVYLWSIWRRLQKVEAEVQALAQRRSVERPR
jgi:CcmD family protein